MAMVTIISSELVVPNEPTPTVPLWLSNLDLSARRGHTVMLYLYRPKESNGHDDSYLVETLKSSLAKVLVPFYPMAGRLGVDEETGRTEIKCSGEGAPFIVARSDSMLDDFDSFAPSTEMRKLFVPPAPQPDQLSPILMVQVTFFKCGGVALGTAMHHMLVDGTSAFHFTETWSNIASGKDTHIVLPFFDHTLLRARTEHKILFDHYDYGPKLNSTIYPHGTNSTLNVISTIEMSKKEVDALKLRCSDSVGARVSAFRAITAFVWRCVCMARKLDTESESRLYTMIDIRNRMCPPLPPTYFGNAVICTSITAVVGDVISSPISHVAKKVHAATKMGDAYTRSLIDYLETLDLEKPLRSSAAVPASELRIISLLGMPSPSADFGWGKPFSIAPAYYSGYVYLLDSIVKDAGVSAVVSLEPETMPRFQKLFLEELAALHV